MTDDVLPEPDRAPGAPHPRETARLIGQDAAERDFLGAYNGGRMHHGWLLTGPRGVGKATLAWRIARFLLSEPVDAGGGLFGDAPPAPTSLGIPEDSAVYRQTLALSEPRLFLLRRGPNDKGDRLRTEIVVGDVRRLKSFFTLSATDGGRRVVIVDDADEMNPNAANALLKLLEEPPPRTVLLLISHRPSGLLPTIRSRCRVLRCAPLDPAAMAEALAQAGHDPGPDAPALAELSGGSVGDALRLANLGGLAIYAQLVAAYAGAPRSDRAQILKLADGVAGRGADDRFVLTIGLIDTLLSRLARAGITGPPLIEAAPGEAALLARLSPHDRAARGWAELHHDIGARLRHGRAVNLDASALILDTLLKINDMGGRLAA
ncbi:DNA polymerase III subunit delta' [Anianabacter salinae]|uniref:DNA polymerase III subunit delta' n=1 Tax=Anianabacter salinae TaxID=2851023 RepID=UPI00225E69FE|nr:DNA polymerase III subunit delta' [Anianabacter salinae]MBV0912427.1 DNA polymerase III subunit delta' [Anianabacter salinae]